MKNFFKHAGLAAGYLVLFFGVQVWAGSMFALGGLLPALFGGTADFESAYAGVYAALDRNLYLVQLLCYAALLLLLYALLLMQAGRPIRAQFRLVRPRSLKLLWIPALLGFAAYAAVSAGLALLPPELPAMQEYFDAASKLSTGGPLALEVIAVALGAPLVEEIVFRGLIYGEMKKVMPRAVALIAQALLFGWVHGQLIWSAFTFALGLLLGLVADEFDSILPSILLHLCFNAANYIPYAFALDSGGILVTLLASLAAVGALLFILLRQRLRRPRLAQP